MLMCHQSDSLLLDIIASLAEQVMREDFVPLSLILKKNNLCYYI